MVMWKNKRSVEKLTNFSLKGKRILFDEGNVFK